MLVTDVFFELGPAPAIFDVTTARRTPPFETILCFYRVEVVDDIPQPEHTTRSNNAPDSFEGHTLPEVRRVMEGVAPSFMPHKAGDWVHTNRRDAIHLAYRRRAGESSRSREDFLRDRKTTKPCLMSAMM